MCLIKQTNPNTLHWWPIYSFWNFTGTYKHFISFPPLFTSPLMTMFSFIQHLILLYYLFSILLISSFFFKIFRFNWKQHLLTSAFWQQTKTRHCFTGYIEYHMYSLPQWGLSSFSVFRTSTFFYLKIIYVLTFFSIMKFVGFKCFECQRGRYTGASEKFVKYYRSLYHGEWVSTLLPLAILNCCGKRQLIQLVSG